jgi:hypothetical protein
MELSAEAASDCCVILTVFSDIEKALLAIYIFELQSSTNLIKLIS